MNLIEVNKPEVKKVVVVYSGRFQPFHKGHYASYAKLVSKFGEGNVYIGTSNDQSGPKSPFSFKEKKEIATKMFGVPSNKFIQIKNPYQPVEILKKFDGQTTQYIAAVGEKDATRLQGKYFKPYKNKAGYGYDEIGYVYPVPAEQNPISGTDVRKWLGTTDKEKAKKGFLKAYPKFDKEVFKMITGKLNEEFPGGTGVGLNLPGGYINGAPTGSNESIAEQEFAKFLQEYFDNKTFLNEEGGNTADGTLDDQSFRSPWMGDWTPFDTAGQNHAEIVGYTMLGHDSNFHKQKTGDVYLPANNPKDENGELKRAIHPSKGPEYAKDKAEKWEMYPYNQRPVNIYPPDVDGTMNYARNINEENLYDPISEIIDRYITNEMFEEWLMEYLGEAPNKALDTDITYTSADGKQKKIKARDALRLPKDHPAHIQAAKIAGPDDAPANEPKPKEQPGKAAQAAAKPAQPGQPVKKGQTAQGKTDTSKPVGEPGKEQGPPPEQKLSGVELKSDAEHRAEKEKNGDSKEHVVKRLHSKLKNWSKEEKETFSKILNKKEGHDERRSWGQAIMDKAKGAGHAIMHGLKHEAQEFKAAGSGVMKLMSGKKLDDHDKKAMLSVGKKIAVTAVMAAAGGGLVHGAAAFAKHVAVELVPHAIGEVLIGGVGKAAMFAEGVDEATALNIFAGAIAERLQNMKLTPEVVENIVDSWNNKKMLNKFQMEEEHYVPSTGMFNRKLTVQQKIDKLNPARAIEKSKIWHQTFAHHDPETGETEPEEESLNETMSDVKKQFINDFVDYATERLKLEERPKITLLSGQEYSNEQSSLGGYNPESKEIFVQCDKRLGADILRTIAHEMIHRKQDEMGLIKNPMEAGKTGSPIENQANAVAGILLREFGKKNKKIYTEDVNVDVDKGDTVLMGKFKNKKVTVKNIGTDDHGMPTINGKQATTFRTLDEMGSKDIHFANMIKLYRDAKFRKRINAYLFGNPNGYKANDVARALRNMGYDDITQMEKELNIRPNLDEVSAMAGDDSQPDGGYLPKGHARKLGADDGVNKSDDWYTNGGYTQTDFPVADAIYGAEDQNQYTVSYKVKNVARTDDDMETDFPIRKNKIGKKVITEGGAYGHMSHPFDDMDLTFGDLKNIITGALNGELGVVREKTDGQALAISWKNGRLIAARNKGHLANAGANAMGIEDVASKFAGRGGLTDAYNYAMKDLSAAISGLSDAQRKKIFNEGQCFMNLEVIWPTSVNVIPYGQALLIFHNTTCYDEKGSPTGANQGAASMLAGMIKQVNADIQSKYTIQGPPVTEIPKSDELSSKQGKYISKLKKLQSEFGLNDNDTISLYHQSWWENFIDEKAPIKVDKLTKEALVRRWAFGDKSLRLNTITNPKLQEWAVNNDKVNVAKQQKDNIKPFEEIFLGVGADVLEFVSSVLTVHPEKAIRSMKAKLKSVAAQVRSGGDPSKIQKLKTELSRLNQLGGVDKIVANEGIVFFYNGKTYKLTGTFAPLNQILGIFYE